MQQPMEIGRMRLLELLEKITEGNGELEDIDRLEELCDYIKSASANLLQVVLLAQAKMHKFQIWLQAQPLQTIQQVQTMLAQSLAKPKEAQLLAQILSSANLQ